MWLISPVGFWIAFVFGLPNWKGSTFEITCFKHGTHHSGYETAVLCYSRVAGGKCFRDIGAGLLLLYTYQTHPHLFFLSAWGSSLYIFSDSNTPPLSFIILPVLTFFFFGTHTRDWKELTCGPETISPCLFVLFLVFTHRDYSLQAFSSAAIFFLSPPFTYVPSFYSKSSSISTSFLIPPCF